MTVFIINILLIKTNIFVVNYDTFLEVPSIIHKNVRNTLTIVNTSSRSVNHASKNVNNYAA